MYADDWFSAYTSIAPRGTLFQLNLLELNLEVHADDWFSAYTSIATRGTLFQLNLVELNLKVHADDWFSASCDLCCDPVTAILQPGWDPDGVDLDCARGQAVLTRFCRAAAGDSVLCELRGAVNVDQHRTQVIIVARPDVVHTGNGHPEKHLLLNLKAYSKRCGYVYFRKSAEADGDIAWDVERVRRYGQLGHFGRIRVTPTVIPTESFQRPALVGMALFRIGLHS